MTDKFAPSAKPSWAVTAWVTDTHVFIEVPTKMQHPFVEKFSITEGGLSKALNFLRTRYELAPLSERNYVAPSVKPSTVNGKPPVQTPEQRTATLSILRKLGIV